MSEIEIRTFEEKDRAELRALFGRAGEGAPPDSLWGHEESEAAIYLTPYADLEPDSLFIAVVDGVMSGYLAGCLDSSAMPSENARMDEAIRKYRLIFRRKPAAFFARSMLDMARAALRREPTAADFNDPRWPSHLHINLLAEARGMGVGAALMNRWFDRLRETGSRGCYLQTLVENTRAVRFFEHMGFEKHGSTPLVPGIRDRGGRLHQQTMVWSPDSPPGHPDVAGEG
ncbi:MAG: GNAT family N-acetyltransferase [Pseudonocardiaceae bacterium]|nr:GNAT family N-acetyltransferase [Pseudonocardiaceae bacterium]